MFAMGADEDDGHDHFGHSHAQENEASKRTVSQEAPMIGAIIVAEDKQFEIGVEVAEVPMRAFAESDGEVTAIPKGSVFREGTKHFILALSEVRADSFEKWEVTLGASDDFFVEAQTGVFPGDRIVVAAREHRSQHRNRVAARERMAEAIRAALAPPPPARRATKPTRGSQERRLSAKRQRAETKASRSRPAPDA